MRSISEKKRSAAAIKSLLDLMAENRSLQSVYTMDGLYATSNQYEPPPERPNKILENTHDNSIPGVIFFCDFFAKILVLQRALIFRVSSVLEHGFLSKFWTRALNFRAHRTLKSEFRVSTKHIVKVYFGKNMHLQKILPAFI